MVRREKKENDLIAFIFHDVDVVEVLLVYFIHKGDVVWSSSNSFFKLKKYIFFNLY